MIFQKMIGNSRSKRSIRPGHLTAINNKIANWKADLPDIVSGGSVGKLERKGRKGIKLFQKKKEILLALNESQQSINYTTSMIEKIKAGYGWHEEFIGENNVVH